MRTLLLCAAAVPFAFLMGRLSVQEVEPSCTLCRVTRVPAGEIQRYSDVGREESITDQQVRSIDIGKTNVQVAVAYRGRLDAPTPMSVAEHDLVTEIYYVLSGSATTRTGPELVGAQRRPADARNVRFLNGPGHNASDIRDAQTHELSAGDVFVIPAGTGHQFTRIDDHISYVMVRVDPDKVVPLMDEAASAAYLAERGR